MSRVVNLRLGHPAGAVRIDRRTKWGNPYVIGQHGDRATVIARYEARLRQRPDLLRALSELRGKDLACWCAPLPCHGDVLLRMAEEALWDNEERSWGSVL